MIPGGSRVRALIASDLASVLNCASFLRGDEAWTG
ncbi:hypothetical protein BH18ACT11_BH18ACT11_10270 [soil metagenome]